MADKKKNTPDFNGINKDLWNDTEQIKINELKEEVNSLLQQEVINFDGGNTGLYPTKANNLFSEIYNQVIAGDHELPDLPNRMREFAFRWVTEHRTAQEWAHIFNVHPYTIYTWRTNPKIVKYAAVVRYKRNSLMLERNLLLENKAYSKLNELLDVPITDGNIESVRKTILDTLNIIQQRLPRSVEPVAHITNINANLQNTKVENKILNMKIEDIRDKLDEMELIENVLATDNPEVKEDFETDTNEE